MVFLWKLTCNLRHPMGLRHHVWVNSSSSLKRQFSFGKESNICRIILSHTHTRPNAYIHIHITHNILQTQRRLQTIASQCMYTQCMYTHSHSRPHTRTRTKTFKQIHCITHNRPQRRQRTIKLQFMWTHTRNRPQKRRNQRTFTSQR